MAEPDPKEPSVEETRLIRGKARGPAPAPPQVPDARPSMRVWPPRPAAAPATMADFSLGNGLSDTVEDETVQVHKRPQQPPIAESPREAPPARAVRLCPRCQIKLIDPEGLGLCPQCSYCRSLAEDGGKVPGAAPRPVPRQRRDLLQGIASVPGWLWGMLAGVGAIVAVTLLK